MSKIIVDMKPDIRKNDCYNIYIVSVDNEINKIAEPIKFVEFADKMQQVLPEPSLIISKNEAVKFFASILSAAKNCGMNFNDVVSDELKAIKDERDYLRHLVDKMLEIIEIIYKSPV